MPPSLTTYAITRRRRAARPKPAQSAGLPSPAARQPYWPSLAAAVPDALPLPILRLLASAMECQTGTATDQAADDDILFQAVAVSDSRT